MRTPALIAIIFALSPWALNAQYSLDKTPEEVQRKAVIVGHDTRLYEAERGDAATQAKFMDIYFRLQPARNGRIPVSRRAGKLLPDGWLKEDDFAEWNTLQMVDFETQSGRPLVSVFSTERCAEQFGETANAHGCNELGSEPPRSPTGKKNYRLLIPVMKKSPTGNYHAGFVRTFVSGQTVEPAPRSGGASESASAGGSDEPRRVGYDLVLAVDSTASMGKYFKPATEVLVQFLTHVRSQLPRGELRTPLNIGILFYRDRKSGTECHLEYLHRWGAELSPGTGAAIEALSQEHEAKCGSDEEEEAVLDALNRIITDTQWNDGHFKVILLVGDAPPHDLTNELKNPAKLTVEEISRLAGERNIRFLTFKIEQANSEQFRRLALEAEESVKGRFREVPKGNLGAFKRDLASALVEEWSLVTKTTSIYQAGFSGQQLQQDPQLQRSFNVSITDLPIIVANLPPTKGGKAAPDFVMGWAPAKIQGKLALKEHIFITKNRVKLLNAVFEGILSALVEGEREGPEAFITQVKSTLAAQVQMPPEELFRQGESLESVLAKRRILPFPTQVLSFTADEINAWRPSDWQRLHRLLDEKTKALREFYDRPTNLKMFGDRAYVFVPRELFP